MFSFVLIRKGSTALRTVVGDFSEALAGKNDRVFCLVNLIGICLTLPSLSNCRSIATWKLVWRFPQMRVVNLQGVL